MKLYLIETAPPAERWHARQADADKLRRQYGGTVETRVVGEDGRDGMAALLNSREPSPLARTFEEIRQSNTPEAQAAAAAIANPDKPAFSQADVDAMFSPPRNTNPPTQEAICLAIADMDGVPLGQVALEVAARLKALASPVGGR